MAIETLAVTYPAGSAQDRFGNPATLATVIPVHPDRLPAPLPEHLNPELVVSVQAGTDDGFNLAGGSTAFAVPAPITFPNLEGLSPGEKSVIWSFDHDAGSWRTVGNGTVSGDARTIVSDPGVGILAPGWHFTSAGSPVSSGVVPNDSYYVFEYDGFQLRGVLAAGEALDDVLPGNTNFELIVFDVATQQVARQTGRTAASGQTTVLPALVYQDSAGLPDVDGEGLVDLAERAVGTSLTNPDTDQDGINDLAEVLQGLSPLGANAFPTGVIANLNLLGPATAVELADRFAYVATGDYGLAIVDITRFDDPIIVGQLRLRGTALDVSVDPVSQTAVVVTADSGTHFVDVSDPLLPVLRRTATTNGAAVEVIDSLAYVASDTKLVVFECSTAELMASTFLSGGQNVTDLAIDQDFVYAVDANQTLYVLERSGVTLVERSTISVSHAAGRVFAANGTVYVTSPGNRGGYSTINVQNPSSPTVISGPDIVSPNIGPGTDVAVNAPTSAC
ncbi:MAG: hypothetical protein R3C28_28460 [Pirellulaceae bacterium]